LGVLDALMLGLGISFLIFGFPLVRSVGGASRGLALAAHLSLSWLLIQWWPHGSMHIAAEDNLGRVLMIDYIFHVPMVAATLVLLRFISAVVRGRYTEATPAVTGTVLQ